MSLGLKPKGYFMYKVLAGLLLIITFLVAAAMIIARQNAVDGPTLQAEKSQLLLNLEASEHSNSNQAHS